MLIIAIGGRLENREAVSESRGRIPFIAPWLRYMTLLPSAKLIN